MKKNITVIMKASSKNHKPQDRIKEVARGYAFNYLIPQQKAEVATQGKIRHLNMLEEIMSRKENFEHKQSIEIKNRISSIHAIRIRKKCSKEHLIFGSISEQDIAKQIQELTGQTVDKKQVVVGSCKKLGKYVARIIIEDRLEASIILCIVPKMI